MRKRIVEFSRKFHQRVPFFITVIIAYVTIVMMMFGGMQLIRNRAHGIITENYLTQRQYALDESVKAFQQQIENFRSVETAMTSLEQYADGKLVQKEELAPKHYYTFSKIRKTFSKHCNELLLSNDCFMYFRTSGTLVRNTRFTFDAESYFENILIKDDSSETTFQRVHAFPSAQHQLFPVTVQENGQVEKKLLYLYHWQSSSVIYGMFLNESMLSTIFNLQDQPPHTQLRLTLHAPVNQPLYVSDTENVSKSQALQSTMEGIPLTAQLVIPSQYFRELTQPISNLFAVYIISTLIAALVLSLTFAMGLTRPLRNLLHMLPTHSSAGDNRVKNEIYLLGQRIRSTHTENIQMRMEIEQGRKMLQQNILSRLVVQESISRVDRQQIEEYLCDLGAPLRLLCLRLIDENGREMTDKDAYVFQQALLTVGVTYEYIVQMSSDIFLFLFIDSSDFADCTSAALEQLCGLLNQQGLSFEAGSSEAVTLDQLHDGYLHAQYAMRYFTPPLSVFKSHDSSIPMRYADLGAFRNAILDCDEAEANRLLDIFRQMRGQYRWLNDVLSYMLDSIVAEMNLPDVAQNESGGLGIRTHNVIQALQEQKNRFSNMLADSILDYMNTSFGDSSLSVDSIAEHFNISKSYLYQLFKSSGQMAPGEKLEQIRMQNAQSLLVTTQLGIAEIAMACGYNSSNTFHKVYKKYHGCTPGTTRAREGHPSEDH